MSTLRPGDVEGAFIALLRTATGVHVSTRIPTTRPDRHIKVTRAGGSRANLVQERPLLIIECWGPDSVAAFDLAASAWQVLDGAEDTTVNGVTFGSMALASPISMPDPDTGNPRYQFTAQPFCRLSEAASL